MLTVINHKRWLLFFLTGAVIFTACARRVVKPSVEKLTLFVSGDISSTDLAKMAGLVKMRQNEEPVLWLAAGRVMLDKRLIALSQGEAEIRMFEAAGVDAMVFMPEWLRFGLRRANWLIDQANLRVLCCNLDDTLGLPVAHPWMVKRIGGSGFGITAALVDSNILPLNVNGVRFVDAVYAGRRVLTLLRTRADFNILVLPAGDSLNISNYDLVLTTGRDKISCYQLTFVGNRLSDVVKTTVSLEGIEPLPEVKSTIDSIVESIKAVADEPVIETRVRILPRVLTKAVVDGILNLRLVDCFVYDSSAFVLDTILSGMITKGQLVNAFADPDRLVILRLEGERINRLQHQPDVKLAVRKGLPLGRLMARKVYQVGTTTTFLKAHPEIPVSQVELSERQLWEYAADILQAAGKK